MLSYLFDLYQEMECPNCNTLICTKCKTQAHSAYTCEENQNFLKTND